jgi:hypothetical protein
VKAPVADEMEGYNDGDAFHSIGSRLWHALYGSHRKASATFMDRTGGIILKGCKVDFVFPP